MGTRAPVSISVGYPVFKYPKVRALLAGVHCSASRARNDYTVHLHSAGWGFNVGLKSLKQLVYPPFVHSRLSNAKPVGSHYLYTWQLDEGRCQDFLRHPVLSGEWGGRLAGCRWPAGGVPRARTGDTWAGVVYDRIWSGGILPPGQLR